MTDTRDPCSECGGTLETRSGLIARMLKVRRVPCTHCHGSGREPRIVDSGPVHFEITADIDPIG